MKLEAAVEEVRETFDLGGGEEIWGTAAEVELADFPARPDVW